MNKVPIGIKKVKITTIEKGAQILQREQEKKIPMKAKKHRENQIEEAIPLAPPLVPRGKEKLHGR